MIMRAFRNIIIAFGLLVLVLVLLGGFQLENVMRGLWRISESYVNKDIADKSQFKMVLGAIVAAAFILVCLVDFLYAVSDKQNMEAPGHVSVG